MSNRIEQFGVTKNNEPVQLITLNLKNTNDWTAGAFVQISTYGAALVACHLPGRGKNNKLELTDVVLGYDNIPAYQINPSFLGVIIGRYAGRTKEGQFKLPNTDKTIQITRNYQGLHTLHGGNKGLQHVVWKVKNVSDDSVLLEYTSPDGEDGYPGTMVVQVKYTFTATSRGIELISRYEARLLSVPEAKCPISMTNHTGWNLAGHAAGREELLKHEIWIDSDQTADATEASLVATGKLISLTPECPTDFRTMRPFSVGLNTMGSPTNPNYDLYYIFRPRPFDLPATIIYHKESGRRMRMYTNQLTMQLYTGTWLGLSTAPVGKHGKQYEASSAFFVQAQGYPDVCNQPSFPATILQSGGEPYIQNTTYVFDMYLL